MVFLLVFIKMLFQAYFKDKFFFFFFKLIFLRETERAEEGHGERGRERESQVDSALLAQSPTRGSDSQTVRSRPELKPRDA